MDRATEMEEILTRYTRVNPEMFQTRIFFEKMLLMLLEKVIDNININKY